MVRFNSKTGTIANGEFLPFMHVHSLVATKDVAGFKSGNQYNCYITEYDNGRFAAFTSSGVKQTIYHCFDSAQDLHDHFDEL